MARETPSSWQMPLKISIFFWEHFPNMVSCSPNLLHVSLSGMAGWHNFMCTCTFFCKGANSIKKLFSSHIIFQCKPQAAVRWDFEFGSRIFSVVFEPYFRSHLSAVLLFAQKIIFVRAIVFKNTRRVVISVISQASAAGESN